DAFNLAVLNDPKGAFPPYDAVLLLSPRAAKNKDLAHVLESLINRISVSAMRNANRRVDEDGITPKAVADNLLDNQQP
ncbi:MAG: glycine betaine ABC transporter substrate-binding protein, partial [Pirellulales bacterium]